MNKLNINLNMNNLSSTERDTLLAKEISLEVTEYWRTKVSHGFYFPTKEAAKQWLEMVGDRIQRLGE